MTKLQAIALCGAVATLSLLGGCNRSANNSKPAVVVYTSVDDVFARPIAEKFRQETGIEVRLVPDTEETKSAGLLNRLIAEKARPQADVFWSGDAVRAAILKAKGVSAPYKSPQLGGAEGLPAQYSDPEGHWTGFSSRARVIICNRNLVPVGQQPKSILDLLEGRFKGKACIANPLFGTTSMHAAALFVKLRDAEARKFFDGFAANGGKILSFLIMAIPLVWKAGPRLADELLVRQARDLVRLRNGSLGATATVLFGVILVFGLVLPAAGLLLPLFSGGAFAGA